MTRLRRLRPSPRGLCLALAAIGAVSAVALVVLPVQAAFGADPLLRLHSLGNGPVEATSQVSCGSAVGNLTRSAEGVSLYGLARDEACQRASTRRVATGIAGGGVIAALALVALAAMARPEAG